MFQLVRLVGPARVLEIVAALDFVWLSHTHADHILGVFEVARAFSQVTGKPLKVFGPKKLHIPAHLLYRTPKPAPVAEEDEDGGVTVSGGSSRKPGDWDCTTCGHFVFGSRNAQVCPKCNSSKIGGAGGGAASAESSSIISSAAAAADGKEAASVPWLTFLSSLEGVPMRVASCSDLEAWQGQASGAGASTSAAFAAAIREDVPGCELVGVEAVRVEHRFEIIFHFMWKLCPQQAHVKIFSVAAMRGPSSALCRMGKQSSTGIIEAFVGVFCNCAANLFPLRVRVRVCARANMQSINPSSASLMEFSGDTMPCAALEVLGRSAALVIHEANFEDSMLELAKKKKHSTTRRAAARA